MRLTGAGPHINCTAPGDRKVLPQRRAATFAENTGMTDPLTPAAVPPPSSAETALTSSPWQQRFANLGSDFVAAIAPAPLPEPYWVGRSPAMAQTLGLAPDWAMSDATLQAMSGNQLLPGSAMHASVYSGHQFGVWAGQLGDGRACLLGELAGQEVQLKGAGPTPFSRRGDGRAVLRSAIREFLCSEAMHGLGIPTTRALCVTGSDATIWRESAETAAVVARVAPSFIRFGHFEHFSQREQIPQLQTLADFVIDHYYPQCRDEAGGNPYLALLGEVSRKTAELLAHWQAVGFCHGVMNSDNMSILGLTLDYGPFQFLDAFAPGHICNHSDTQGRYAFSEQPNMAYWNLYCLTDALMPLIGDEDAATQAVDSYRTHFQAASQLCLAKKMGLSLADPRQKALTDMLLPMLAADQVDYTIFWRRLSHWAATMDDEDFSVMDLFVNRQQMQTWQYAFESMHKGMGTTDVSARMLRANPKFVLRNYMAQEAIVAAQSKDFSVLAQLQNVLDNPFDEHPAHERWAGFAPDWAAAISVSCSS